VKVIEVQAKTVELAIEEGLETLGCKEEDVSIEIQSQGGMFKKAKIKLTLKKEVKEVKEKPKAEPVKKEKPVAVTGQSTKLDTCVTFVQGLLSALGSDATISVDSDENHTINISGGDVGRLIGKGGEALYALQTVVTSIAISNQSGDTRRVYVNVEGYKEKREETLKGLASKKAEYVKKTGRFVKLEPMTPRDRAIIHTALQDIEGVRSYSTGQGNMRCLVVAPATSQE